MLRANDYASCDAPGQRCCGALHAHAGDLDAARALARREHRRVRAIAARTFIAVNAAGLRRDDEGVRPPARRRPRVGRARRACRPRVRDVSELLAAAGPRAGRAARRCASPTTRPATCCTRSASSTPPLARAAARSRASTLVPLDGQRPVLRQRGHLQPRRARDVATPCSRRSSRTSPTTRAPTGRDRAIPGCLMQIGAGLRQAGSRRASCIPSTCSTRRTQPIRRGTHQRPAIGPPP